MIPIADFPALDAALNALSALLLSMGFIFIRNKKVTAHKVCMLSAFASSTLFLVCYLWYHAHHGVTRFTGQGAVRGIYFSLLGSHTVFAMAVVPMVLMTLYRALSRHFDKHRRIARWTLPLWLYVSITGVLVYWMLYRLYPPR